MFWALPQGSGYPLQVLAPSGCGLSITIPNAGKEHQLNFNTKD